ncbi:MAG: histidinol-phosphatase HisJ family protein [Lachnospiraceae bacterium]|nr:histidinol-phosphatase HisJ family protein [Lachnospiraceae bacterium]
MKIDFHVHSSFSGDCDSSPETQVLAALEQNLDILCFTEHLDADYFCPDANFILDTAPYLEAVASLREKYADRIAIYTGVELGLQPHLTDYYKDYAARYPFDFIIGSTHLVNGEDPYYPSFWEGKSPKACLDTYFETTLKNIQTHDCFDSYGHLDYMIRYIPKGSLTYSCFDYMDLIDECLRLLITRGQALEVNTGGYKAGLPEPNPGMDILKRYKELGGELLTFGSDAHFPQYVGYEYEKACALIKACGFRYLTVYKERKATPFLI